MKQTVSKSDFIEGFYGDYGNNFSYEGKAALFDFFEEYEADIGEEIEFDPITICRDYCEYDSLEEFHDAHNKEEFPDIETLSEHTQFILIERTDGFIIQNF